MRNIGSVGVGSFVAGFLILGYYLSCVIFNYPIQLHQVLFAVGLGICIGIGAGIGHNRRKPSPQDKTYVRSVGSVGVASFVAGFLILGYYLSCVIFNYPIQLHQVLFVLGLGICIGIGAGIGHNRRKRSPQDKT